MQNKNTATFTETIKNSIIVRIMLIAFLVLVMLIPFSMIQSLIDEREQRKNNVIYEINSKWAFAQTIGGPVLEIPYQVIHETQHIVDNKMKKTLTKEIKNAYFLPDNLTVSGVIHPETRYRGIYESIVYTADLVIEGEFLFPDFDTWKIPARNVFWDDAFFSFGITDMRGINKQITAAWQDAELAMKPGLRNKNIFDNGVSAKIRIDKPAAREPYEPPDGGTTSPAYKPLRGGTASPAYKPLRDKNSNNRGSQNPRGDKKEKYRFSIKLNIRGSRSINFLPVGRETKVSLNSTWTSPSFNGLFLPKTRQINREGFRANWEIFDFNRDFPQQWRDERWDMNRSRFGLELFVPVDEYQKTTRSVKYSILFIFLTFLAFFLLIEMLNKKRVHPIQYLLVGFALSMFYLLLISLSEHLSFDIAYLVSTICIVALTTFYTRSVSGKKYLTVIMGLIFSGLYGFLYVILRLEDYSLLMGSAGLFVILAAIMIFTRKIDWYSFSITKEKND